MRRYSIIGYSCHDTPSWCEPADLSEEREDPMQNTVMVYKTVTIQEGVCPHCGGIHTLTNSELEPHVSRFGVICNGSFMKVAMFREHTRQVVAFQHKEADNGGHVAGS